MNFRRRSIVLVAALLGAAIGDPSTGAMLAEPLSREVTWAAIGDSFSSGEGISGAGDALGDICARSDLAYGVRAAELLRTQRSWKIVSAPNAACSGAVTPEVYAKSSHEKPLDAQLEQVRGTADRFDVITLSTGGNDVGFADILVRCLLPKGHLPASWGELGRADFVRSGECRDGLGDMYESIDTLLEPHTIPATDTSGPRDSKSLPDLYRMIVDDYLTPEGVLVVAGYPRIFAPVAEWPDWRGKRCELMSKDSAERVNLAAEHLDDVVREAIQRSGVADRIEYVSRLDLFDNNGRSHSLCGAPTTEWLNGITFVRRYQASFHPNEPGHAATAELTATRVEEALGSRLAPTATTKPDAQPTTSKPPIATGDRYELGDRFAFRCTIAWPTAPTRSAQGITMRTSCPGVNKQFLFVDIFFADPDLPVTPSRSTMDVEGVIIDVGESEMGFKVLMVEAYDVSIR